jgi:hypothetical protein
MKEELKELKRMMKEQQNQGTAKDLGLIEDPYKGIITPQDPNFSFNTNDSKYPLTGDLSRFVTSASKIEDNKKDEE